MQWFCWLFKTNILLKSITLGFAVASFIICHDCLVAEDFLSLNLICFTYQKVEDSESVLFFFIYLFHSFLLCFVLIHLYIFIDLSHDLVGDGFRLSVNYFSLFWTLRILFLQLCAYLFNWIRKVNKTLKSFILTCFFSNFSLSSFSYLYLSIVKAENEEILLF